MGGFGGSVGRFVAGVHGGGGGYLGVELLLELAFQVCFLLLRSLSPSPQPARNPLNTHV